MAAAGLSIRIGFFDAVSNLLQTKASKVDRRCPRLDKIHTSIGTIRDS